ncbi:ErfK/YbiS/YcfS/YnhG family protein [Desulfofarcimen acetoxidans DSM 771]|uniref:ErfK/YbiS/YcfS/YnhG family protein n=1 Tax=Desulfofarcimen acetoxidans (strain ATCC 49208 / DSM 771 / KCTC 5769 / VKM B-1644 / 5575) TaxID=485916 RepID=C8VWH5_DESAS|nr:peptidoglycan-binding protein [Desulfofarcimen acetoxidans]ACV64339.1 ErfK/YbiS/YcfS/YnhG family protein [Desulfofarcimen acetoxidans DSM 771]
MVKGTSIWIIIFFVSYFTFISNVEANTVCPFNCEQERVLYLCSPNMKGKDVQELQEQLMDLGLYEDKIDGVFGPSTAQAVQALQEKHGVKTDGIVNVTIWAMLLSEHGATVTQKESPPPQGKPSIVVDTVNRTLTVFIDNEPYRQYYVAVGKPETPTPIGSWTVVRKAMNWGTGFGTRWIGLNVPWGIFGIHGTNKPYSIGGYESHGCIRMHNSNVEAIYPLISVGTPVYITGNPFGVPNHTHRILSLGERGSDVAEVQRILKKRGYYKGDINGLFNKEIKEAIEKLRKDKRLLHDDRVDLEIYQALGL